MRYAIKFADGTITGQWDLRADAYRAAISTWPTSFANGTVNIVRLKPKAKPSTIPVPVVSVKRAGPGFTLSINGKHIETFGSGYQPEKFADLIRDALGTPPPVRAEPKWTAPYVTPTKPNGYSVRVNGHHVGSELAWDVAKRIADDLCAALGMVTP